MPALRWTAPAKADLDDLWFYIAQDNLSAADQYLLGLEVAALHHAGSPEMGREQVELSEKLDEKIRSFRFRNHRINYAVRSDEVRVIRVLHARQNRDANP